MESRQRFNASLSISGSLMRLDNFPFNFSPGNGSFFYTGQNTVQTLIINANEAHIMVQDTSGDDWKTRILKKLNPTVINSKIRDACSNGLSSVTIDLNSATRGCDTSVSRPFLESRDPEELLAFVREKFRERKQDLMAIGYEIWSIDDYSFEISWSPKGNDRQKSAVVTRHRITDTSRQRDDGDSYVDTFTSILHHYDHCDDNGHCDDNDCV